MKSIFYKLFISNWPKKVLSFIFAITVWILVGQAITETRTLTNIPVRIIDLLPEQTVLGLQSNGTLSKMISLTITGNRHVIQKLNSSDLEIVISASGHTESWKTSIDKHNLVSLKDSEIRKYIHNIVVNDFLIHLSQLITEDVVVTVRVDAHKTPKGYEFLDVWPKYLQQKITGPKEYILSAKQHGLELILDLSNISKEEISSLYYEQGKHDEIIVPIPDQWKKVYNPFSQETVVLNDPRASLLRLLFLKQELIPLDVQIPILLFFPLQSASYINPQNFILDNLFPVQSTKQVFYLNLPLYVKEVSKTFVNTVKDNLAISLIMNPYQHNHAINWALEFLNEPSLENAFVASIRQQTYYQSNPETFDEMLIRKRFKEYLRKCILRTQNGEPLHLYPQIKENKVQIILEKTT